MPRGNLNLAVAIAISLAAHVLLWPVSERIDIRPDKSSRSRARHPTEVTLVLNPQSPKSKVPEIDSPEDMGERKGLGTGDQPAKGDTPLKAREADQDQPFLSRDPIGHGRVGDPPAFDTGRRGQNGHGGQAGGSPSAASKTAGSGESGVGSETNGADHPPLPAPHATPSPADHVGSGEPGVGSKTDSADHPQLPTPHSPPPTAPPPSQSASDGAAKPNVEKPAVSEVKAASEFARAPKVADDSLPSAAAEGPSVTPVEASGTAPPTPKAPPEHPAVAIAMASPLPPAPVIAAPPSAQRPPAQKTPDDPAVAKPVAPPPTPASPAARANSAAPAVVSTGDSRAPGLDKPSADPAQESDSESDPFSKNSISAVLHDGRLEVREGRKIKTTRPHFLPGAVGAFLSNPDPVLVLKISIDPTGGVKNVDIVRSTGSVEIDQPCRVAVYDWWFEPSHDKKGRPVADVVLFTIRIR